MKITDVKVETIRIPMKKPFRIAFAVQDHSLNVLVKISTDDSKVKVWVIPTNEELMIAQDTADLVKAAQ